MAKKFYIMDKDETSTFIDFQSESDAVGWLERHKKSYPYHADSNGLHVVEKEHLTTYEELRKYKGFFILYPVEDWSEELPCCLFFKLPVEEPPAVTSPISSDWIEDYYTHFSILPDETYYVFKEDVKG